jgi:hypothetical protein
MTQIVDKRIEAMVHSKMKGEVAQVKEEKLKKAGGHEHDGGAEIYDEILEVTESAHRIFAKLDLALFTLITFISLVPWPDIPLYSID